MKKKLFPRIFLLPIASFLLLPLFPFAQGWIQKANFGGGKRMYAAAFSIGTKGYIGSGSNSSWTCYNDLWEWNQATNVWTQKASFPDLVRTNASGFSIGTKGYIVSGAAAGWFTGTFWEWDQTTNTWTKKASFPGAIRDYTAAFSIGTKGYVGTGRISIPGRTNDFWEWDQATNTWTKKATFPGAARSEAVGFSIGTKGYIGTGCTPSAAYKDFYEYDPATDKWTKKADFAGGARGEAVGFSIGTKGYIGTAGKDFWEWDQATDTWTRKADYSGAGWQGGIGFSIGCKGYIGIGIASWPTLAGDFWEYSAAPTVTITSQTNVSCNGGNDGTVTVAASGGVSPYTYKWSSGGATTTEKNLKAGVYTVTVSDSSSCAATATTTVTITEPAALSDTIAQTQKISCNAGNNGSVTVTPSGGTTPYQYLWSSGETTATIKNLATGSYKVTITDSLLCTKVDSITITEPKALSDSIKQLQKISCNTGNNGVVIATASGGTAPYKYLWSSGGTTTTEKNLTAGTYRVTITDSMLCTKVDSITISEPSALSIDTNITDANCSNTKGTATVAVSGGTAPYTYVWNDSLSQKTDTAFNLSAGTYAVTVTDSNGCTATSVNIAITDIQIPVASFTPPIKDGVAPVSVAFTNSSINAVSYLWNFEEAATSTDSNPSYTFNNAGTYTVVLTAYSVNGCTDTALGVVTVQSEQSTLWIPTSFTPNKDGKNDVFKVGYINLAAFEIQVFNRWGELIYESKDMDGGWDGTFRSDKCPEGVYTYVVSAKGIDNVKYNKVGSLTLIR